MPLFAERLITAIFLVTFFLKKVTKNNATKDKAEDNHCLSIILLNWNPPRYDTLFYLIQPLQKFPTKPQAQTPPFPVFHREGPGMGSSYLVSF